MKIREKKYNVCPRCGKKNTLTDEKCVSCGLIFARLKNVTNKAAKKAISKKEYNKVIEYNVLPPDLNKWKLFVIALFFGWIGVHYLRVGKYKTFVFMVFSTILLFLPATGIVPLLWMQHPYLFLAFWACIMPASISVMLWVVSAIKILFNKFKVPVAIDEEYIKEKLNLRGADEILEDVKKEREQKLTEEKEKAKSNKQLKKEKIRVVCASCGAVVKVNKLDTICPKCDEPLKED